MNLRIFMRSFTRCFLSRSNGSLSKSVVASAPQVLKLVLDLNELTAVPREVLFFTSITELSLGQNKLVLAPHHPSSNSVLTLKPHHR